MNLTGGQFKGLKIDIPQNARPTLSKTRQGVFNILNQFEYNSFFDMFSGSGLMGLEALSRGYSVMGLELNPKNLEIIKKNYKKINKNPNILLKNALNYKTDLKFDIVYLDPPWDFDYEPVIKKAKEIRGNTYDRQNCYQRGQGAQFKKCGCYHPARQICRADWPVRIRQIFAGV